MADSRRVARWRHRFPVTVQRTTSFTVNLSAGGFCTEMMRVLPPGTRVEGKIRVHDMEYAYTGRVVWSRQGAPRMNVRGRMGICFSSIAPGFLRLLESLPGPDTPPGSFRRGGPPGKP